jgi:hypothetical protein
MDTLIITTVIAVEILAIAFKIRQDYIKTPEQKAKEAARKARNSKIIWELTKLVAMIAFYIAGFTALCGWISNFSIPVRIVKEIK